MAKREVFNNFIELPKGIQQFLLQDIENFYDKLITDYKLPQDQFFDNFDAPVLDAVMGVSTIPESLKKIHFFLNSLQFTEEQEIQILIQILKNVFWPIRDLFAEELTGFLRDQEIETNEWPRQKVLYKPISYTGAASELVNRLGLHSAGQKMHDSLRTIIKDYNEGKLVDEQIKETALRPTELGGLGFDQKMADKALVIIKDFRLSIELMNEDDYREYLASKMARTLRSEGDGGLEGEDDDQIKTLKANAVEPPKILTELDKAVDLTWQKIENKPETEYLQKRLKNVISSRLRDIRSGVELKSLLQRDTKVGGLGLTREQSDAVSVVIEQSYEEFRKNIELEERKKFDKQLAEQKLKIEERRHKEAEEHAKWYEEKIKKRQASEVEQKQIAQAIKKGFVAKEATHPLDGKDAALERKKYGNLVALEPKADVVTQESQALEQPRSLLHKDSEKGKPVNLPVLKTNTIKVSTATLELNKQAGRATIDGVVSAKQIAPKLHGLIDELSSMTLSSFRRLSKDPKDAAKRIEQNLTTLEQDGLTQKMSGIKAWHSSPLTKVYLDLVSESFKQGKPLAVIAENKRNAGENTLTRDEIEVLIDLNNRMHF